MFDADCFLAALWSARSCYLSSVSSAVAAAYANARTHHLSVYPTATAAVATVVVSVSTNERTCGIRGHGVSFISRVESPPVIFGSRSRQSCLGTTLPTPTMTTRPLLQPTLFNSTASFTARATHTVAWLYPYDTCLLRIIVLDDFCTIQYYTTKCSSAQSTKDGRLCITISVNIWDNSCEEKAQLNKCDLSARLKAG